MKFVNLAKAYEELENTTKRLKKTKTISEVIKKTDTKDLSKILLLIQGRVFPSWDQRKIGVAARLIIKAINIATGIENKTIESEWKKLGDLGLVCEKLVDKKKQVTLFSTDLSVDKVFDNLQKLASMQGSGAVEKKIKLIAELLTSAKPIEARYITRTILEELRVGAASGSIRDAIVWANFSDVIKLKYVEEDNNIELVDREVYNKYVEAVQNAIDLTNDFAIVAKCAKEDGLKGLKTIKLEVGKPIKVMLALKVNDIDDGFERCGKPSAVEYKYDGFRIQCHKKNDEITLFTRRLENVTPQFPEVVEFVKNNVKGESFILDCEAVGYDPKTGKYLPFQSISQRIKRKYDIEKMAKDFPVELNIFDIIYFEGKNLIKEDFEKRRKILEKIVSSKVREIVVSKSIITKNSSDVEKFYKDSLDAGNEGLMFKKLDAPYKPGARVGYMVKLKPTMDTMDLVITGAEWGEGKRSHWLSSFNISCIDENGEYLEIGKVGTGIKEKEGEGVTFSQLTDLLKPLITAESGKGVKVKPKIVIEINFEEIQKSPTYNSGFALRFPRLKTLREDRSPEEITTLDMVQDAFYGQKK